MSLRQKLKITNVRIKCSLPKNVSEWLFFESYLPLPSQFKEQYENGWRIKLNSKFWDFYFYHSFHWSFRRFWIVHLNPFQSSAAFYMSSVVFYMKRNMGLNGLTLCATLPKGEQRTVHYLFNHPIFQFINFQNSSNAHNLRFPRHTHRHTMLFRSPICSV